MPAGKKALDAARAVLDKAFGQRLARLDGAQRSALLATLEALV